jgi:hypothetical protein
MKIQKGERRGAWGLLVGAALSLFAGVNGCSEVLGIDPWEDPEESSGGEAGAQNTLEDGGGGAGGKSDQDSPDGATCVNGEKDGLETDVDCGGDTCVPCVAGKACGTDLDCATHYCVDEGVCAEPPAENPCDNPPEGSATCTDCIKNESESDVDCGGDACRPCGVGKTCGGDYDCLSEGCVSGTCALGASGKPCHEASDCASGMCQAGGCWTGFCCS